MQALSLAIEIFGGHAVICCPVHNKPCRADTEHRTQRGAIPGDSLLGIWAGNNE